MLKKITAWSVLFSIFIPAAMAYDYPPDKQALNHRRYTLFKSYAEVMSEDPDPVAGHSEAARLEKNMRLFEKKLMQAVPPRISPVSPGVFVPGPVPPYVPDNENLQSTALFLKNNITGTRMPLSFRPPDGYWKGIEDGLSPVEEVLERIIVQNSLNIYDGALWQMALSLLPSEGTAELADLHTQRLLDGEAGDIHSLRGSGASFRYGDEEQMMDRDNGYFFRMISDRYIQDDPLGRNEVAGFPNFNRVHHEDWKPVTGEQAWAAIIGPLQTAFRKYGGKIPADSPEMKLALSVLPALKAMQSPLGAFYHAPKGTYGIHPKLISNENNFSVYAALAMLEPVLEKNGSSEADEVKVMKRKLESFFAKYAYDRKEHLFYLAGFYVENKWVPGKLLAVDCQTWAIAALGPGWIDAHYGRDEAYKLWEKTIELSGSRDARGALRGVGFTSDREVISVEWTCGAILAARLLAGHYAKTDPARSALLLSQADQMRRGIEAYKEKLPDGGTAYLYASERYFIPFGWWANPVPSLASSAWVIFIDLKFNPFVLGGDLRRG